MVDPSEQPQAAQAQEDLLPTTERVTVEDYMASKGTYIILSLHLATYDFAIPYVAGKRVLDLGCGTGYGTERLAAVAQEIIGVDVSERAITHARQQFTAGNLSFRQIGLLPEHPLPFDDDSFDVIVSFQVIEHIRAVGGYLDEVRRVLRPEGDFLCVTPDRTHRLLPGQRPWNPFHCTEYRPEELVSLLRTRFADVTALGMTAPAHIISHELKRYRRAQITRYPFTFPGAPERWRTLGLTARTRISRKLKLSRFRRAHPSTEPTSYGFGPADILIKADASPSVNIVAIAHGNPPTGA